MEAAMINCAPADYAAVLNMTIDRIRQMQADTESHQLRYCPFGSAQRCSQAPGRNLLPGGICLMRLIAFVGTERLAPMQISRERAFWLFDFYRSHQTRVMFGGRILGEEASCAAVISHVWNQNQTIGIKLLSDDTDQSWERMIPLSRAHFLLLQMGDPHFEEFANGEFHSILSIRFPDGTTMFFGEPVVTG